MKNVQYLPRRMQVEDIKEQRASDYVNGLNRFEVQFHTSPSPIHFGRSHNNTTIKITKPKESQIT